MEALWGDLTISRTICTMTLLRVFTAKPTHSLVSHGQTLFRTDERVWDMAIELLSPRTVECVPTTAQYSVTCYLKYVINGKIQNSVCVESELEAWEVRWARSVLSHELHTKSRVQKGYFGDCHRWRHNCIYKFLNSSVTSCSVAMSQTLTLGVE